MMKFTLQLTSTDACPVIKFRLAFQLEPKKEKQKETTARRLVWIKLRPALKFPITYHDLQLTLLIEKIYV